MRKVVVTRELIQDLRCVMGIDPDEELREIIREDLRALFVECSDDRDVVIVTDVNVDDYEDQYLDSLFRLTNDLLRSGYNVSYERRKIK